MINYYAGTAPYEIGYSIMKNHLIVWFDTSVKARQKYFKKDCNILVDSGAFSAFTIGKKIDIYEYAEFINGFLEKWKDKVISVNFINLDVIGDANKSWENQHKLEKLNVKTVPVIHREGFEIKHLEKAYKEYDYFAFGGLVGKRRKTEIIPFLDYCFKFIFDYVRKGNKLPRTHLLGVADTKVLYRYPAFSCDSTKWLSVSKYGESFFLNLRNSIPRAGLKENTKGKKSKYKNADKHTYDKQEDHNLYTKVFEYEIKQYRQQEKEITEFWKKRGIDFEI